MPQLATFRVLNPLWPKRSCYGRTPIAESETYVGFVTGESPILLTTGRTDFRVRAFADSDILERHDHAWDGLVVSSPGQTVCSLAFPPDVSYRLLTCRWDQAKNDDSWILGWLAAVCVAAKAGAERPADEVDRSKLSQMRVTFASGAASFILSGGPWLKRLAARWRGPGSIDGFLADGISDAVATALDWERTRVPEVGLTDAHVEAFRAIRDRESAYPSFRARLLGCEAEAFIAAHPKKVGKASRKDHQDGE